MQHVCLPSACCLRCNAPHRRLESPARVRRLVVLSIVWMNACSGELLDPRTKMGGPDPAEMGHTGGRSPGAPAEPGAGSGPGATPVIPPAMPSAPPSLVRRLTRDELLFTLEDTLGVKLAATLLPRENTGDGLSNDAVGLVVTADHAQAYHELGPAVTRALGDMGAFVKRFSECQAAEERCESGFVRALGGRLFRRSVTAEEVTDFRAIFAAARAEGLDFVAGATGVVDAMLQAPQFLYRIEAERTGAAGVRTVTAQELASRLSYFLWASAPDAELAQAARSGALDTPAGVSAQVSRMIAAEPRIQRASARFVRDWLWLDKLESVTRDDLPSTLGREMLESTVATVLDTLWTAKKPLPTLFDARSAMLTPPLATWVGLKSVGGAMARYDLTTAPERAGLLTHPGVVTVMSDSDNGGIVARGLFILERVLCRHTAPPPATLDTTAFTTHLGKEATERQYSEDRLKTASCGVCHRHFDPLAYAFERLDGVGRFRSRNAFGVALEAQGEVELDGMTRPYENAVEFSALIAASDQLSRCATERALQSALGRLLAPEEAPLVATVEAAYQAGGGSFPALFSAIANQAAFRTLRTE